MRHFFARPSALWDLDGDDPICFDGDVHEPHGPEFHVSLGFMQKPTETHTHLLLFCEGKYYYQRGEGSLEVEDKKFKIVEDFSGFAIFLGVTF